MMTFRFISPEYQYGFHVTKYPSMVKTISEITKNTPLTAIQLYISNSRSKAPPVFDYDDLFAARKLIKNNNLYVVVHGSLLYNLAGTTDGNKNENYYKSLDSTVQGLTAELDFGVALGCYRDKTIKSGTSVSIPYRQVDLKSAGVVIHPGSQQDKEAGIKTISETIEKVLTRRTVEIEEIATRLGISVGDAIKRRFIILENAAGEGTKICSTLKEISDVINGVREDLRDRIGVCIDTAHAFGKGLYDWGKEGEIDKFYKDFQKEVGLDFLRVFHFNDSRRSTDKKLDAPFGSRKDRHAQLGKGYTFDENDKSRYKQIREFMLMARKHGIPVIGEPPESGFDDWNTVKKLLDDTEFPLEK